MFISILVLIGFSWIKEKLTKRQLVKEQVSEQQLLDIGQNNKIEIQSQIAANQRNIRECLDSSLTLEEITGEVNRLAAVNNRLIFILNKRT